ncbi:MAG: DinB family protein [Chloroflexota bacterium]|nr:DinB family protein [Chloroflexota bacterium]
MSTQEEIVAALADQRRHIEGWFAALPAGEERRPLTASEVADGGMWSPKDHLAHVLGVERFFQGAIKRMLGGAEDPLGFFTATSSDDPAAHFALINQANERSANKYRDETVAGLLGRFDETRQATLALLATLDESQLAQTVPHSPYDYDDTTLGGLFRLIASHGHQHLGWLDSAIAARDQPGA